MTMPQNTTFHVKDYRFTIPKPQLPAMQAALVEAAQAGQSPHPYRPEPDVKAMVLLVWGLDLFANRSDRGLTALHVPSTATLQAFETFLSLIAPFVSMDKPAYFDVLCQAEEGDQEFFYHVEQGKVVKEERVTIYIPAELDIKQPQDTSREEAEGRIGTCVFVGYGCLLDERVNTPAFRAWLTQIDAHAAMPTLVMGNDNLIFVLAATREEDVADLEIEKLPEEGVISLPEITRWVSEERIEEASLQWASLREQAATAGFALPDGHLLLTTGQTNA